MEDLSTALKQALHIKKTEFEVINANDEKTDAPCRFFDLPAEIRNLIYDWVLWRRHVPAGLLCTNYDGENFDISILGSLRMKQSFLLVNKQFSTELAARHFCHTEYRMRAIWCPPMDCEKKPTNKNYALLHQITNCVVKISQQVYLKNGHRWSRLDGIERDARFLDSILAKMTSLKKVKIQFEVNKDKQVEEEEIMSLCPAYRNLACQRSFTLGVKYDPL